MPARKKILLIDDSEITLGVEEIILRRSYDIVMAKDGEEGVRKARAERPDLILCDVVMPSIDGFETCRRLRADPLTEAVPIILVTSQCSEGMMVNGFESGCSDYVTKPIQPVELLEKVKNCIGD
ncbi:response regulator [Polyangium sp. 15x6]|uniref:response regulator n=1 Tax=Polyangium sp. 15x6 TaxID=3042687 RepID=UPI00249A5D13|nr:response regulator [Polyangium sp. 15x6]MDI3289351.1 response regulator [Polyangium sp. 15x6]